jgi:phenylacetate-CoA ligase
MDSLERVLRAAMVAPGNRNRFEAAGLITRTNGQIDLQKNWQAAFSRLQPIARETIRQHPDQFLASVDDIVYRGSTSGTRGQYFVYFADAEWNRARLSARRSSLEWWGIHESTPILNVGSRLLPVRQGDMALAGTLTSDFIERLLHQLATTPAVIRGYPSRLCDIAAVLVGQNIPGVLGLICTGELLFDFQKTLLEQVFAVPVINEYGCQESGISGLSCPEVGRLHLDSDRCLYEIIDGQLVSTDLFNVVMPMVRYQCGDRLQLHSDPCPCGRTGPTAIFQGRVEDMIRTRQGKQYLGDIQMPTLPGILCYGAIRGGSHQVTLHARPNPKKLQINFQPLIDWAQNVFGEVDIRLSIDKPVVVPSCPPGNCDVQTWIDRITKGSWSIELNEPHLLEGEGYNTTQLFHHLVNPAVMMYQGVPLSTWALIQQISQATFTDAQIDKLTARILLFACSFLWNDPSVESIYRNANLRLTPILQERPEHPANFDRLIPTLILDTKTSLKIWIEWLQKMDDHHPNEAIQWQVDTFTLQHLLQALESAVQRAWQVPSHSFLTLRPFLAVLIGDLSFFAPRVAPWLLAYWFELLHQQPFPQSPWLRPPEPDEFAQAWLVWRQQLIKNPKSASLSGLSAVAKSPKQQERIVLEKGYGLLLQGQQLNPGDWVNVLRSMGESRRSSGQEIDIVPWQPILNALVKPLFEQGQCNLAYDCLRAVTVPSSRISAFERFASQCNQKQYVLGDLLSQIDA